MKKINKEIEELQNRINRQKDYEWRLLDELSKAYEMEQYGAGKLIRNDLNSVRSLIMQLSGKLNELIRQREDQE